VPRPAVPLLVATLVAGSAALTPSRADELRLDAVVPERLAPHAAATLELTGAGFGPGLKVLLESAEGRFLTLVPVEISASRCRLELPLGLGASPPERRLAVVRPDGTRSDALRIRIAAPEEPAPDPGDVARPEPPPGSPGPGIEQLRPAAVAAGLPFVLEVVGRGFEPGARVLIVVNRHAGSSRLPDYAAVPFPALFVDSGLLEVELERGFYPIPAVRDVVVENPGGAASGAAVLRIVVSQENPS
jgi:hypothetical protein